MRLIVDANILFSALIKDNSSSNILVDDRLKFYAPDKLFSIILIYIKEKIL